MNLVLTKYSNEVAYSVTMGMFVGFVLTTWNSSNSSILKDIWKKYNIQRSMLWGLLGSAVGGGVLGGLLGIVVLVNTKN